MRKLLNLIFSFSAFLLLVVLTSASYAETITLNMVPPVSGVAHITTFPLLTPDEIMMVPLSTDQDLANLLDNNPNTFYQPSANSNPGTIGSDVLLRFEFPDVPTNAIIESVVVSVGISAENAGQMGFGFVSYSRADPTRYLDIDIGPPGTKGVFIVSDTTPPFDLPPLVGVQSGIPSVYNMTIAPHELNAKVVRNLSVVLTGINEAPSPFDRISLVNATINYSIPSIPTLSTWMMAVLGVVLLGAALVFRKKLAG